MFARPATHSGSHGRRHVELDNTSCPLLMNSSVFSISDLDDSDILSDLDLSDAGSSVGPRSVYYSNHESAAQRHGMLTSLSGADPLTVNLSSSPSGIPQLSRADSRETSVRDTQSAPTGSLFDSGYKRAPRRLESLADQTLEKFLLLPPDRHLSKLWPHPLKRCDPDKVYAQLNGGWACDECGVQNGKSMYHCFRTGNFDLCDTCVNWRGIIDSANPDTEPLPSLPSRPSSSKRDSRSQRQARLNHYEKGIGPRQEFFQLFRSEKQRIADTVTPAMGHSMSQSMPAPSREENDNDPNRAKLVQLYRSIDTDYSDEVSTRELWEGLASAGMGMSRDEVKRLIVLADVDGSGALSMDEFVDCFASKAANDWKPNDLVRVSGELSAIARKSFMKRKDINNAVWKYVEEKELKSGWGADAWIEFDPAMAKIFVFEPPAAAAPGGGEGEGKKKKSKKKDAKPPGISHWDLSSIIDDRIDLNVKSIYRKLHAFSSANSDDEDLPDLTTGSASLSRFPDELVTTPRTAYLEAVRESGLVPKPVLIGECASERPPPRL